MVAIIGLLGQTLCFWVNFLVDARTELLHTTFGMGIVFRHEEAFTTHDLVLVNILRNLFNPSSWGELESEGGDKDSGCCKDALAELFTSNLCSLENQGEPFAGRPLNEEGNGEDKDEGPAVEELLEDV